MLGCGPGPALTPSALDLLRCSLGSPPESGGVNTLGRPRVTGAFPGAFLAWGMVGLVLAGLIPACILAFTISITLDIGLYALVTPWSG